jgi:hypothetical protein
MNWYAMQLKVNAQSQEYTEIPLPVPFRAGNPTPATVQQSLYQLTVNFSNDPASREIACSTALRAVEQFLRQVICLDSEPLLSSGKLHITDSAFNDSKDLANDADGALPVTPDDSRGSAGS